MCQAPSEFQLCHICLLLLLSSILTLQITEHRRKAKICWLFTNICIFSMNRPGTNVYFCKMFLCKITRINRCHFLHPCAIRAHFEITTLHLQRYKILFMSASIRVWQAESAVGAFNWTIFCHYGALEGFKMTNGERQGAVLLSWGNLWWQQTTSPVTSGDMRVIGAVCFINCCLSDFFPYRLRLRHHA